MQPIGPRPYPTPHLFTTTADVPIALAERANQVDHLVVQAGAELLFPTVPEGLALISVGGYGRRQLFPYSDVDLLLLCQNEDIPRTHKPEISAFLQRLWDSGLRVSQSVRTPDECLEVHDHNTELNISLLDQRFLAGDRPLFAALSKNFPRFVQSNRDALMRNLVRLTRERHAKYADTFYHLEPNVKETPGGLRDYQFIRWMEQLREADANRLTAPQPPDELRQAFRFLTRLRSSLHTLAGRDQNVLTFDAQDALADNGEGRDVASWMREYYRHARTGQPRGHAVAGGLGRAVRAPVRPVRGLALAAFQRRFRSASRAGSFSRSAPTGFRPRVGAAPLRIRGAPRHPPVRRSRPPD